MMTVLTIVVIALGATLWVRATTRYILEADRLLIRRAGFVWMDIPFRDVVDIESKPLFFDKLWQIKMSQLGSRRMLRIRRRRGFRYVLINPRDPAAIIAAFTAFRARSADGPP